MSSQNNPHLEDLDLNKSSEEYTSSHSSAENNNNEHQTIHGNAEPKNMLNDPSIKKVSSEALMPVQTDTKAEAFCSDQLNEKIYDIDAEVDIEGRSTLSEEEVEKKFQELGLAFRTDIMTLQKRLIIRKRSRDQADKNLETEFSSMKTKLSNLRYLCYDSESLEQLSDLLRHLDIILETAHFLSGSSESYGFVLNEEKMSGAVSIILRQIENIERIQNEISKSPERENSDGKRSQLLPIMDDDRFEERILRRRSVAALALNGAAKRRASIASVPRNLVPSDESNGNIILPLSNSSPLISPNRTTGTVSKKSTIQCSTPKSSPTTSGDQVRNRKESRVGDDRLGIQYMQDYNNHHAAKDGDELFFNSDDEIPVQNTSNTQLTAFRMSGSFDSRIRTNSVASETLNIIDSLRDVVKWNAVILRNTRFQFPDNVHQYVPFLITWYVTVLIVAIFTAGFFTGFNRCFYPELFLSCTMISGFATFWITAVIIVLRFSPFNYMLLAALVLYVHSLYHTLNEEGLDSVFKRLDIQIETYYTNGAPI